MITNNLGYIFECRKDCLGSIGVMESFKVLFRGDEQKVTLTHTIDNFGKVVMPAYNDKSLGFKPVDATYTDDESLSSYFRSNKPYFGKLGEFSMIASGNIIFNKNSGELISVKDLCFYVPKTTSDSIKEFIDNKGYQHPALICERLSTTDGLNNFKVSETIYNSYVSSFLSNLDAKYMQDKTEFLRHVLARD